ncbi:uncharacterized protein VTP21DRAFT_3886 [Calcarisporiella thermophila]|uniref:uncharacterized protein n=1 Tax=Calcarisporiella thermophila TaxID=911321 RepID=UPI00374464A1
MLRGEGAQWLDFHYAKSNPSSTDTESESTLSDSSDNDEFEYSKHREKVRKRERDFEHRFDRNALCPKSGKYLKWHRHVHSTRLAMYEEMWSQALAGIQSLEISLHTNRSPREMFIPVLSRLVRDLSRAIASKSRKDAKELSSQDAKSLSILRVRIHKLTSAWKQDVPLLTEYPEFFDWEPLAVLDELELFLMTHAHTDTSDQYNIQNEIRLTRLGLREYPPHLRALDSIFSYYASFTKGGIDTNTLLGEVRVLDLSHNMISAIPKEVGLLRGLTTLLLVNNCLQFLPPEIVCLTQLRQLGLAQNPELHYRLTYLFNPCHSEQSVPPAHFPTLIETSAGALFAKYRVRSWSNLTLDIQRHLRLQLPPMLCERLTDCALCEGCGRLCTGHLTEEFCLVLVRAMNERLWFVCFPVRRYFCGRGCLDRHRKGGCRCLTCCLSAENGRYIGWKWPTRLG